MCGLSAMDQNPLVRILQLSATLQQQQHQTLLSVQENQQSLLPQVVKNQAVDQATIQHLLNPESPPSMSGPSA